MSHHPRRTAAEWQQLVEEQQESGSTQKAFCEMRGIRSATFGYWKRKLISQEADNHTEADSSWLDLSAALGTTGGPSKSWKIELDLGNGVVLRLNQQ